MKQNNYDPVPSVVTEETFIRKMLEPPNNFHSADYYHNIIHQPGFPSVDIGGDYIILTDWIIPWKVNRDYKEESRYGQ